MTDKDKHSSLLPSRVCYDRRIIVIVSNVTHIKCCKYCHYKQCRYNGSFTLARYRGQFRIKPAGLVMKFFLNKTC